MGTSPNRKKNSDIPKSPTVTVHLAPKRLTRQLTKLEEKADPNGKHAKTKPNCAPLKALPADDKGKKEVGTVISSHVTKRA
mmetsp:Transcript_15859/g.31066  ORF Transcript_15859/g.31066 Transcript_15859/m.31066 type:complete len:81 (-) Transcript_15859:114-356(-)